MKQGTRVKQKGSSLVEVLVGIAVFLGISVALFSSFLGMKTQLLRQEELIRFEMLCRDIDAYYDTYGADWDEKYFADNALDGTVYFDSDFKPCLETKVYRLDYVMKDGALVVNVYHNETNRPIIEELNYGEANVSG